jgi:hypothetical protein
MTESEKKTNAYFVLYDPRDGRGTPGTEFAFCTFRTRNKIHLERLRDFIEGRTNELPDGLDICTRWVTIKDLIRFRDNVFIGRSRTFGIIVTGEGEEISYEVRFDPPY